MRISIFINNISLLENNISVATEVSEIHFSRPLKSGSKCLLAIEGEEFAGLISSVREKNTRKHVLLHFPRILDNFQLVRKLYHVQYSDRDFGLLVEEKADPDLFNETERLLKVLSHRSGQNACDILMEITSFKPGIPGKRDLRYVSPKQLKVVRDKCEERIGQVKGNAPKETPANEKT
ncbi:MAG TPA: hypothetical protein DCP92_02725 [Nitrospiraceae bacterium]|jgi:hypothetical protein|nr:hypothetical protein [Nitrospiraceae bacterium]